jgi:hypothetical protein
MSNCLPLRLCVPQGAAAKYERTSGFLVQGTASDICLAGAPIENTTARQTANFSLPPCVTYRNVDSVVVAAVGTSTSDYV